MNCDWRHAGSDDYEVSPPPRVTEKFVNLLTGAKFRWADNLCVKVPEVRMEGWLGPFFYNCITETHESVQCLYVEPDHEVELI